MTLDEAIKHLKESLADSTRKWGCEECKAEHEQLLEFLQELKKYRETFGNVKNTKFCIPECKEGCENLVKQYESENAELKRLLRLAVRDIGKMKSCEEFSFCVGCPKENEPYCEWKHNDEAMKLIGGAENSNG